MIRGDLGHVETLPVVVEEPGEGVGHRLRLVVICAAPTQPAIHSLATVSAEMEWQQGKRSRKQALAQDCADCGGPRTVHAGEVPPALIPTDLDEPGPDHDAEDQPAEAPDRNARRRYLLG